MTFNLPELSTEEDTGNVPTSFDCSNLSNNSSLEEAKYCLGGNFIGTGGGGLDIWDGINVSAYLNSTSPTGRTIQVSVPDIQDGIYIRFNITDLDDDGRSDNNWQYVHYSFGDYPDTSRVGMGLWQLPIPTYWDKSEIDVYWKLSTTRGTEFAFTGMPVYIDGQAIDGIVSSVPIPALDSKQISITANKTILDLNQNQDLATVSIDFANIDSGISYWTIKTPDMQEYLWTIAGTSETLQSGLGTSFLTYELNSSEGGSWSTLRNNLIDVSSFDSFQLIVSDGPLNDPDSTQDSIEFQIIDSSEDTDSIQTPVLDVDNTPPKFEKGNNILVDATTSNGATVKYEIPKVTDDGGITDTPVCKPKSGTFSQLEQLQLHVL